MAKDYLNRSEQHLLWFLGAINYSIEEELKELQEHAPHKKDLIKFLKYIRTYSEKAIDEMTDGLDPELLEEYIGKLKRREVSLNVNETSFREKAEQCTEPVVLEQFEFYDLVDIVLSKECRNCSRDEKCKLRNIFLKHEVPLYVEEDELCPYRQAQI